MKTFAHIDHIPVAQAEGKLKRLYERVKRPDGDVDNIMKVHSLRPHTLEGHMALYKNVLHHSSNTLPKWLLEATGVYVSQLNGCAYCVDHHLEGLKRLLKDDARAEAIEKAIKTDAIETVFEGRDLAVMRYAEQLTRSPGEVTAATLDALRAAGLDDGEILEVNQVVSYFAYANRTVLGLGVTTKGDTLGLSPSDADDPENWRHQ